MDKEIVYIDKVGSEDLITFHEAQFENFGYYYNGGRENRMNNVIEDLYNLRLSWNRIKTQHR